MQNVLGVAGSPVTLGGFVVVLIILALALGSIIYKKVHGDEAKGLSGMVGAAGAFILAFAIIGAIAGGGITENHLKWGGIGLAALLICGGSR